MTFVFYFIFNSEVLGKMVKNHFLILFTKYLFISNHTGIQNKLNTPYAVLCISYFDDGFPSSFKHTPTYAQLCSVVILYNEVTFHIRGFVGNRSNHCSVFTDLHHTASLKRQSEM